MTRQTYKYISIPVALTLGLSTAIVFYFLFENNRVKDPGKILEEAKSYFMDKKGSYILHQPFVDDNLYSERLIYQGGITQNKHNKIIEYVFYADAKTGEILNIQEL
ncbi:PepSY domain-containing protein [Staphylococcus caledonicus]|uniref:PepSY domain-containing protein n=1 Tax=Staphylococcus caledonicus TaxID=2741333 RepID=UPI003C2E3BCD